VIGVEVMVMARAVNRLKSRMEAIDLKWKTNDITQNTSMISQPFAGCNKFRPCSKL
jgi:hypothetical protein